MKKISLFVLSLFLSFFAITCDPDIGLGGNEGDIPENIFDGNTWEIVYYSTENYYDEEQQKFIIIETDKIYQGRTIFFTENNFSFRHWSDNDTYQIYYDITYTGTYELLPRDNNQRDIIKFFSDDPRIDGIVYYDYVAEDQYTTDGKTFLRKAYTLFFWDKPNKNGDFIMGGMWNKVN